MPRMKKVTVEAPLDGGYGWVITFSAFMTGVILDGFSFSFGLFYDEFLDYFQESKAKTAWIGSVYNGMYMSIGPIVSFICNRFGCRITSIVGGLIASVACFMAVFANSVSALIVTYGFLGGFGFGMMYLPAIVMVGHYFDSKRALATGIAVCGSGVGAFVFAYFTKYLIITFTWRGATLILSGVALNGVVLGALLRPLEARVAIEEDPEDAADAAAADTGSLLKQVEDAVERKGEKEVSNGDQSQSEFYLSLQNCRMGSKDQGLLLNKSQPSLHAGSSKRVVHIDISRPKFRQDAFLIGSCASIVQQQQQQQQQQHQRNNSSSGSCNNKAAVDNFTSMTDVAAVREEIERIEASDSHQLHQNDSAVRKMVQDFRNYLKLLTRNPALIIYGSACFLCMAGFFVPFTYIPVYAKTLSLHESAPQDLLSAIGWVNLVSRLLIGWVADRAWADCLMLNTAFLIIGGTVTGLFVFYRTFTMLLLACIVFGACIAVFVALRSIIGVELVGVQHLSQAFGIIAMCQGLSSFIGTPIAGLIADITGETVSTFYFAGAAILLSGLICAPLRKIASYTKASNEQSNQSNV